MYIEPCCCDKQLPQLLRSGVPFFQTSGDVTLDKFLNAVSSMAGQTFRLTIAVPAVDVAMLRLFAHYFNRGWLTELRLCTRDAQTELIRSELADHLSAVKYAIDPMILDSLMAMQGTADNPPVTQPNATVIIQGALMSEEDFAFSLYGCYFGTNEDIISGALQALESKIRMKPQVLETE